jgi:hypothetical protein
LVQSKPCDLQTVVRTERRDGQTIGGVILNPERRGGVEERRRRGDGMMAWERRCRRKRCGRRGRSDKTRSGVEGEEREGKRQRE